MERESLDRLQKTIQDHTRRKTIDQLKAEGKRHVRVVSGKKVMQLIQAVVNDIVDDEVHQLNAKDRERIIEDSQRKFDRVLKLQQEQDDRVRALRDQLREGEVAVDELRAEKALLERQLETARTRQDDTRLTGELTKLRASVRALGDRHASELARTAQDLSERIRRTADDDSRPVLARITGRLDEVQTQLGKALARIEGETSALRKFLDHQLDTQDTEAPLRELVQLRESLEGETRRLREAQEQALDRFGRELGDLQSVESRAVVQTLGERLDQVAERLDAVGRRTETAQQALTDVLSRDASATRADLDRGLASLRETLANVEEQLATGEDRAWRADLLAGIEQLGRTLESQRGRRKELEAALVGAVTTAVAGATATGDSELSESLARELSQLRDGNAAVHESLATLETSTESLRRALESDESPDLSTPIDAVRESLDTLFQRDATLDERLEERGAELAAALREEAETLRAELGSLVQSVAPLAAAVREARDDTDARLEALPSLVAAHVEESIQPLRGELGELGETVGRLAGDVADLGTTTADSQERLTELLGATRDELSARHDESNDRLERAVSELDAHVERTQLAIVEALGAGDDRVTEHFDARLEVLSDRLGEFEGTTTALQSSIVDAFTGSHDALSQRVETRIEQLQGTVTDLERRVGERLETSLRELREELVADLAATRAPDESLRADLGRLEEEVARIGARSEEDRSRLKAEVVDGVRELLESRAADQLRSLEERFESALDKALDKIDRTLEAHTAKPVEVSAEATSVLLDKIFDAGGDELSTNLGRLDVEETSSRAGIGSSVARLRALRGKQAPAKQA